MRWALLFLAGGLGAVLRFAVSSAVQLRTGGDFPWGTAVVNVVGCFAIGVLATLLEERQMLAPELRLALLVGLLGGFTTFSTFGIETWRLLDQGAAGLAVANVLGSVVVGVAAVALGIQTARSLG